MPKKATNQRDGRLNEVRVYNSCLPNIQTKLSFGRELVMTISIQFLICRKQTDPRVTLANEGQRTAGRIDS